MGAAIVPRLVAAGHRVSVWNRSCEAVDALDGVERLERAADAFGHDVVISMLADDRAVREVLIESGAISRADSSTIHIVMSTISLVLVQELKTLHDEAGIAYVAAPVFGVPAVAAAGALNILAAGSDEAIASVQPVFDVMGKTTWRLGADQRMAHVAKIAGNLMITQAIESMAEAAALTEAYGVSAEAFLGVVTQTMFASPSYQRYARNIARGSYEPGFKLSLGLKDVNLARDAARDAALELPAMNVVRESLARAVSSGLGSEDWSALTKVVRGEVLPDVTNVREAITVLVTYTGEPGSRFDRTYYVDHHIPMVEHAWRPLGLEYADALFPPVGHTSTVAVCVCRFRDEAAMRAAFASRDTAAIMADVVKFTDIAPTQHVLTAL